MKKKEAKPAICGAEISFDAGDNNSITATCKLPQHKTGDHQGYMTTSGEVYVQCRHCKSHVKEYIPAVVTWKNLGNRIEEDDENN